MDGWKLNDINIRVQENMKNKALTHWCAIEHKNVKAFAAKIQITHTDTNVETQNTVKIRTIRSRQGIVLNTLSKKTKGKF